MTTTQQLSTWISEFGREYTDRNTMSVEAMDLAFQEQLGVRKTSIYRQMIGPERLSGGRVLEVGCNIGLQLALLDLANPGLELHGLEPQSYALARARELAPHRTFHQGTAFALPFADQSFDLVMTNGVLIHIAPADLPRAMAEIHRVARRFIWCHEYFATTATEVHYHGRGGLLWKADFAAEYRRLCPELRLIEERRYPYSVGCGGPQLSDQVALLHKGAA